MQKTDLRIQFKNLRASFSEGEITIKSIAIANQLLRLPIWDFNYFHLFLSIAKNKEVDTEPILSMLHGRDKNIVLSKSDLSTRTMQHILLTDSTTFKLNHWAIPEPVDGVFISPEMLDVVFVPLLAYDKIGHRVGYGQGFYDEFLNQCHRNTLKIGLSFFEPVDIIEDVRAGDVSLDFCVTPEQVYQF